MIVSKYDKISNIILGAIILTVAWGVSTVFHEVCHFLVAGLLGYEASIGAFALTTGSVFVNGEMCAVDVALIAVAGSVGLIVVGVLLVRFTSSYLKMAGIVFLCRAWVDVIPIGDLDGGLIVGSVGAGIAYGVAIAEVLVCGGIILCEIQKIQKV